MQPTPGPLSGRAALVTGGGSGIGLACARALRADGAAVTIAGRSEERLVAAAAELEAEVPGEHPVRFSIMDVADEEQVASGVQVASAALGGLDLCVAAAGRGSLGPLLTTSREEWDGVLATNLTGTFLTAKHACTEMARRGGGVFVAVSSLAGVVTHPFLSPYAVSKAGINMLVRSLADELGRAGVRVHAVCPSLVDTDLVSMVVADDGVRGDYLAQMPMARVGTPEDIAELVRFLCGPGSTWMTGEVITIDGGHHLRRGPSYEPFARVLFGDDAVDARFPLD